MTKKSFASTDFDLVIDKKIKDKLCQYGLCANKGGNWAHIAQPTRPGPYVAYLNHRLLVGDYDSVDKAIGAVNKVAEKDEDFDTSTDYADAGDPGDGGGD